MTYSIKTPSLFLLFVLLVIFHSKSTNCLIVRTSYGSIEGSEVSAENGDVYHVFKKLPFAQPPIGKLRFQKPETVKKWDGVLNGKEYGPACLSNSTVTHSPQKVMDEDCLHANIFTTERCLNSKSCPVVFYIHGGGMAYDSAVMFNDTFLLKTFASRDIILVISAFRLGIFSHFIVEDQSVAPTNIGAYDILQALEFVNSEIRNFGGDPNKVTLFGHSYGGAVASAFTFSQKIDPEKRLFQQVISMSPGREFRPLATGTQNTKNFAKRANCVPSASGLSTSKKEQFMLECLQKMDQFELLGIQRQMEEDGFPEFGSMVQREPLFEEGTFSGSLTQPKSIPMVMGCNLRELNTTKKAIPTWDILGFENPKEVDRKWRYDQENGKLEFALSDEALMFKVDVIVRANQLKKTGAPLFVYEYNYPKHSEHTDDLSFIMGIHVFEKDENEEILSEIYPKLFMDFVKFGKPADDWDVWNSTARSYYDVNYDVETGRKPEMRNGFEKKIYNYWFVEMKNFDRNVTLSKKTTICKSNPKLCTLQRNHQIKSLSTPIQDVGVDSHNFPVYFLLFTIVFLLGMVIGKFYCSNSRREQNLYIQLEGNDYYDGYK